MSLPVGNDKCRSEFNDGLAHVAGHLNSHLAREAEWLGLIESGVGNSDGCMRSLTAQAIAVSLVSWFRDHDLAVCKQAAYVSAKIDRIRQQASSWQVAGNSLVFNLFSSWTWLVSDCEPLIEWRTRFEPFRGLTGEEKRPKDIHKTYFDEMFVGYQLTLALRRDWQRLGERTEHWLAEPPSTLKKMTPDMRFFLALAKGDVAGMEAALAEIVTPKQRRWRENWQGGYTGRLMSEEAVVYAKLAWRNGYQVDVDTPYIPKAWLPVSPLQEYTDPYDFMREFDIWQPLPE